MNPFAKWICPVKKAMTAVSAIPMNRAPFTFSTISTILMISPISVKMTAGE
ncbi:hypothetical protein N2384_12170 [Bacillus paralicheniformis]|nr:hypothetical protein [Bacillus paralicheniformis]UWS63456.1 hypothetical protein N2384_12170 [Bacillus paralicheniformis]